MTGQELLEWLEAIPDSDRGCEVVMEGLDIEHLPVITAKYYNNSYEHKIYLVYK